MTDAQLYLAIGVPILFNGIALTIMTVSFNGRLQSLENNFNARFASIETRLEILTGKVAELADRVARLEERVR